MEHCPDIPEDLLKHLNKVYPESCPNPLETEREIWMKAGERRLIHKLNAIFEQQNSNDSNEDQTDVHG